MTAALEQGPIAVRIGLHTGTPLHRRGGLYRRRRPHRRRGSQLPAHGGQVILSAATAELVELELTDLGEHRLKDIAEAVPIYQLGTASFPPLKTISNTNLPRPASSFVGREAELARGDLAFEDGARLVTLTGPGGTGKTRLAIEAASSLSPPTRRASSGSGWQRSEIPALVTETIAQTLGAKDGLAEHIGERELLLLLDNLEQVIAAAPDLSELAHGLPEPHRCSSRAGSCCAIRGEVEYAVPPLAEPEAVSLFCERAQLDPTTRSPSSAAAWTTCRSPSSSPPPARRRSRLRRSSSGSRSGSTC